MLSPGTKLGNYEVTAHIGSGGMGDVYQAHDTKLGRNVAIKVLPEQFARDPERLARFQREAKLLAALNHPNIATIHGLEQSGDTHYLVMELVPGETLRDRILRDGALPVDEVLKIARQIAEALEAAHGSEKGIIHRDLKPANVKVTPEGRVKVLDFGLAKVFAPESTQEDVANSPTLSMNPTMQGVILGTAGYMSPEQVKGKPLDKRTDVWAFGCVVYEMLTGKQLFAGETLQDTLACVLQREPDWQTLPESVPPRVRALLRRCLQRDMNRRTRDAGDLCLEIDEALAEGAAPQAPPQAAVPISVPGLRAGTVLPWIVAAVATAVALVLGFIATARFLRPPLPPPKVSRFSISIPPQQRMTVLNGLSLAVSPDGTKLVYVSTQNGVQQLYLRAIDALDAKPIPETEGATGPFFSPDGRWIAFFAAGHLKKAPVGGGAALTLAEVASPTGGAWGPDNTILFGSTTTSPILQISADGGAPKAITQLDRSQGETNHLAPQFLPGGQAFLYTVWTGPGPDEGYLVLHSLRTGEHRKLAQGATSQGFYLPPGYLVFVRSGVLMATRFDLSSLQLSADPAVPVMDGISEAPLSASIALSAEGTLAYLRGYSVLARKTRMVEVDRQGHAQPLSAPPGVYWHSRFSPDGRTIAVATNATVSELWTFDLSRGSLLRFGGRTGGVFPSWSPDGKRIAYMSFRNGVRGLYSRLADGTGSEDSLISGQSVQVEAIGPWSPDGALLAFVALDSSTGSDIWLFDARTRQTRPLLNSPFSEGLPAFSPDGRWLAYSSDESGRREIYVQPFRGPGPKRQISTEGGTEPAWPRNGHELFFRSGNKTMAVDVRTEPTFTAGAPHALFEGDFYRGTPYWTYDVSSDGQRFLFLQPVEPDIPANQINVILNFNEELKRRLPAGN